MKKKLVIVLTLLTTLVGIGRSLDAPAHSQMMFAQAALSTLQ